MISVLLKTFDFAIWKAVLLILTFFGFGTTVIDLFYKSLHGGSSLGMNAVFPVFMGGIYGVYIVLGYFIKKGFFQKTPIWKLVAGGDFVHCSSALSVVSLWKKHTVQYLV